MKEKRLQVKEFGNRKWSLLIDDLEPLKKFELVTLGLGERVNCEVLEGRRQITDELIDKVSSKESSSKFGE